jgi:hypothetical protein
VVESSDHFDWSADNESVVVLPQDPIAVYLNTYNEIVIRQRSWPDEDSIVVIHKQNLDRIIEAIRREALLDANGHQGQGDGTITGGTAIVDTRSERREGEPQGDKEP